MSAAIVAIGALSPLGRGTDAYDVGQVGARAKVAVTRDATLEAAGFARPFAARVADAHLSEGASPAVRADRASHLLFGAFTDALDQLSRARPGFRGERIGIAIGTSSGGMRSAERSFELRLRGSEIPGDLARASTYFAPFALVLDELGLGHAARRTQLVTACAASTWAIGLATRWLAGGEVDVAIAGGYDALGPFVAAGFEALRATSASAPAPFRVGRDGMALGEGAGVLALVRADDLRGARAHFFVTGFGASTDAVHVTAPDRTGDGLARALRAALDDAGIDASDIESVSAHATSTPYNDAMEARALRSVFREAEPVVHPFKAQIGHSLGAAGVLETLAIADALARRVLPASAGAGPLDEDAAVRLLEIAAPAPTSARPRALKESAAFGGANAALVVEAHAPLARTSRPRRGVHVRGLAHVVTADVEIVARTSGAPPDRIARFDELSLLAATSVARLVGDERGAAVLRGGGVIVGHALATVDINDRFYARVLGRGPTAAEPRLFPPTSPNLVPGQLAILFGLTGPSAATCGSLLGSLEALEVGADLIAAGDVDRILVVALDRRGPASGALLAAGFPDAPPLPDGAVAVLLDADGRGALRPLPSPDTPDGAAPSAVVGHVALARRLGLDEGAREVGDLA